MFAQLNDHDAFRGRMLIVDAAHAVLSYDKLHCLVEPSVAAVVVAVARRVGDWKNNESGLHLAG